VDAGRLDSEKLHKTTHMTYEEYFCFTVSSFLVPTARNNGGFYGHKRLDGKGFV